MDREADGALRVAFRAGGMQEMSWHLFTWGTAVTVVAPERLRECLADMAAEVAAHHQNDTSQARDMNEKIETV
jgi:predicted DNA-binding transcriptional regulator YafY